jgi:hypothetical protein
MQPFLCVASMLFSYQRLHREMLYYLRKEYFVHSVQEETQMVYFDGHWVSQIQSYITTDSQSASLSWCQAPIWDPPPIFTLL